MPRKTEEWWGKTDDSDPPPSVKRRVKSRACDCCEVCGIRVRYGGQVDHTIAIINGGENREQNLRFLCRNCHQTKTKMDVAEKSRAARKEIHLQTNWKKPRSRWQWRTFNGELRCNWKKE